MRKFVCSLIAIGLFSVQLHAADAAKPAAATTATAPSIDEVLQAFRADLQAARADIIAKNVQLSADQAAKFWPAFAKFQAEQSVIVDEQLQGINKYAANFNTLDDAGALALIDTQLSRDQKMYNLRTKWLTEFQKILPIRTAARVIQIDRRLGQAAQLSISARIPLIE